LAESHIQALHSPFELRKEAESLLHTAIRSQARRTRKHLLAGSFERIRRAETMSEPPEAAPAELPAPLEAMRSWLVADSCDGKSGAAPIGAGAHKRVSKRPCPESPANRTFCRHLGINEIDPSRKWSVHCKNNRDVVPFGRGNPLWL